MANIRSSVFISFFVLVQLPASSSFLEVTGISSHYVVELNSNITVNCSVSNIGANSSIAWSRLHKNNTRTFIYPRSAVLTFNKVGIKDAGMYSCDIISGLVNSSIAETEIIVEYPPITHEELYDGKTSSNKVEKTLHVDKTSVVKCPFIGNPAVKISWTRNDGAKIPNNVIVSGKILVISASIRAEMEEYICTAKNKHGIRKMDFKISQIGLSDHWYSQKHFAYIIWPLSGTILFLLICILIISWRLFKPRNREAIPESRISDAVSFLVTEPFSPPVMEQSTQTILLQETIHKIRKSIKGKRQSSQYYSYPELPYVILPPDMSGTGDYEYVNPEILKEFFGKKKKYEDTEEPTEGNEELNESDGIYETGELYVNSSMFPNEGPEYLELSRS